MATRLTTKLELGWASEDELKMVQQLVTDKVVDLSKPKW